MSKLNELAFTFWKLAMQDVSNTSIKLAKSLYHNKDIRTIYDVIESGKFIGPEYFVHFTDLPQLLTSINYKSYIRKNISDISYKSTHLHTPLGFYAYLMDELYRGSATFAKDRSHAIILKYLGQHPLHLGLYSNEDLNRDKIIIDKFIKENYSLKPKVLKDKGFPGKSLISYVYSFKLAPSIQTTIYYNILGYDCIIDPGLGAIHINEPIQAVFFKPTNTLSIEEIVKTSYISYEETEEKILLDILLYHKDVDNYSLGVFKKYLNLERACDLFKAYDFSQFQKEVKDIILDVIIINRKNLDCEFKSELSAAEAYSAKKQLYYQYDNSESIKAHETDSRYFPQFTEHHRKLYNKLCLEGLMKPNPPNL